MTSSLLLAFGLVLVIEGILPLVAPQAWRQTFQRMVEMKDGQLRFVGLASMLAGLLIVLLLH
ncbi:MULTISPECIES: DUF2065 domain-containing protein [Methylobacillus]|uniref:DUF2065 domain-containing protein n=1 Tax=Methylobacillus flagellatus (strain ATCC 51484 / DSM 6875 / VKM B-1610 / KT) TaxID=265072 RepID=Q1H0Y4_METFK|nr:MULTISPECIES: DUF2065 domain-containing protein [Methylobacillus]ABE49853.1 conserved hypothetical protein [Methylobacillus flagellatus KT]MPS48921.1 DUF2065 domain-containing protein [Methylobacillus sp.]